MQGDVRVDANFATSALTGTLSSLFGTNGAGTDVVLNDVTFSATILSGTNSFSGTTTATSAPPLPGTYALKAGATGTIDGMFYGPKADELAGVWTLSDGTASEIGSFAAVSEPVNSPAPGSYGATPRPAQIATTGGPTLDGSNGPLPLNLSFPALTSSLQVAPNSVSAVTGNQSATVSIASDALHIVIPSVNIDASFPISGPANQSIPSEFALSYVALGQWYGKPNSSESCIDCAASSGRSLTLGVFGYETPASAMPTSGSANYSGAGAVRGTVFVPETGGIYSAPLIGDANLSVNFATGSVSGGFTKMKAIDPCFGNTDWNDVSVNASHHFRDEQVQRFDRGQPAAAIFELLRFKGLRHWNNQRRVLRARRAEYRSHLDSERRDKVCPRRCRGRALNLSRESAV